MTARKEPAYRGHQPLEERVLEVIIRDDDQRIIRDDQFIIS